MILDDSGSQGDANFSDRHDSWECDSLVELCSLAPVPPVAKTGTLEHIQQARWLFASNKTKFFSLQDGTLHTWSSKKGFANACPSEKEFDLRDLKDMDQDGKLLTLKFSPKSGLKRLELQAVSDSEAGDWFDAVEASLRSMSMPIRFSLHTTDIFQPTVLQEFQRLVDHCFISKYTRDRKGGTIPKSLQLVRVVRVQNSTLLREYHARRDQIIDDLSDDDCRKSKEILTPDVRTGVLNQPLTVLPQLEDNAIERWVFHGTTPEGLEGITTASFDLKRAGTAAGSLYGAGIYCAGCSSKADEYTREDKNGIRGLLLCRASLGKILCTCELNPNIANLQNEKETRKCHTILGDRWRAAGTFREFVFSDNSQLYPEFILYYQRVY
jgi:hypothetical protein